MNSIYYIDKIVEIKKYIILIEVGVINTGNGPLLARHQSNGKAES
jgi:hypothetical protein